VTAPHGEHEPVVVRDKRKIDPVTGEARKASAAADAPASPEELAQQVAAAAAEAEVPKADALLLEERTRDLQRVQAEFANYRRRADRERLAATEVGAGRVLAELLPVLDNIERARQHGDLTGGLKAVAEQLETLAGKFGLVAFGEVGDPFDPSIHEAVLHAESDEVTQPTCTTVMRLGYKHGDRLLRPAMVGVTDPVHGASGAVTADGAAEAEPAGTDDAPQPTESAASAESNQAVDYE
jgi:molecular chaperone GrpE